MRPQSLDYLDCILSANLLNYHLVYNIFILLVLFLVNMFYIIFLFSGTISFPGVSFIYHPSVDGPQIYVPLYIPKHTIFILHTSCMGISSLVPGPSTVNPTLVTPSVQPPPPLNPWRTGYIAQRPHRGTDSKLLVCISPLTSPARFISATNPQATHNRLPFQPAQHTLVRTAEQSESTV